MGSHPLDGVLFPEVDDAWPPPGELPPVATTPLAAPGCVALNLFVRRPDGQPAAADLHAYLGMGAHAIIARVGGDGVEAPSSLWHVHFSVPKGFAQLGGGNGAAACAAAMPGMRGADASAPAAAFGPSLVGLWI